MNVASLYVGSSHRAVQLLTTHEKLFKNSQAFVTQSVENVARTNLFIVKMTNWACQEVLVQEKMNAAVCLAAPALWVNPQ